MRQFINIVSLCESSSRELYHGAGGEGLVGIVKSDSMLGQPCEGPDGASLTTDYDVAKRFAIGKPKDRAGEVQWNLDHDDQSSIRDYLLQYAEWLTDPKTGCGGGVLVFNEDKLREHYELFDYHEGDDGNESEFEVRIPVHPLRQLTEHGVLFALERIDLMNSEAFARYAEIVTEHDPSLAPIFQHIIALSKR